MDTPTPSVTEATDSKKNFANSLVTILAQTWHAYAGFVESVRQDTGKEYPWPAIDIVEDELKALFGVDSYREVVNYESSEDEPEGDGATRTVIDKLKETAARSVAEASSFTSESEAEENHKRQADRMVKLGQAISKEGAELLSESSSEQPDEKTSTLEPGSQTEVAVDQNAQVGEVVQTVIGAATAGKIVLLDEDTGSHYFIGDDGERHYLSPGDANERAPRIPFNEKAGDVLTDHTLPQNEWVKDSELSVGDTIRFESETDGTTHRVEKDEHGVPYIIYPTGDVYSLANKRLFIGGDAVYTGIVKVESPEITSDELAENAAITSGDLEMPTLQAQVILDTEAEPGTEPKVTFGGGPTFHEPIDMPNASPRLGIILDTEKEPIMPGSPIALGQGVEAPAPAEPQAPGGFTKVSDLKAGDWVQANNVEGARFTDAFMVMASISGALYIETDGGPYFLDAVKETTPEGVVYYSGITKIG